jgi:hypothetical protein
MKGLDTVNGNGVLDEALDRGDAIAEGDENGGFGGVLMQDESRRRDRSGRYFDVCWCDRTGRR